MLSPEVPELECLISNCSTINIINLQTNYPVLEPLATVLFWRNWQAENIYVYIKGGFYTALSVFDLGRNQCQTTKKVHFHMLYPTEF